MLGINTVNTAPNTVVGLDSGDIWHICTTKLYARSRKKAELWLANVLTADKEAQFFYGSALFLLGVKNQKWQSCWA